MIITIFPTSISFIEQCKFCIYYTYISPTDIHTFL